MGREVICIKKVFAVNRVWKGGKKKKIKRNGHKHNVFVEDCLFHFSAAVTPGRQEKKLF